MSKLTVTKVKKVIKDEIKRQQFELDIFNSVKKAVSFWINQNPERVGSKRLATHVETWLENEYGPKIWKDQYSKVRYSTEYNMYHLYLNIDRGEGQSDFSILLGHNSFIKQAYTMKEFDRLTTCWACNAKNIEQLNAKLLDTAALKVYVKHHNNMVNAAKYFDNNYFDNNQFDYEVRTIYKRGL